LNPESKDVIIITHFQIKNKIEKIYEIHKDIVKKKLQSILINIYFSIDIWTSLNKYLLLGITGDFINYTKEKYLKTFFGLRSIADYNEENQFDVFFPILQEYGIVRKLKAVISDNSGTNDTFYQIIEAYLRKEEEDLQ
jgi:hypothetical protein